MKNFNWFHFVLFAVTGLLLFCCLRVPANAAEGESKTYTFKDQYWNDDLNFYYTQRWRENMSTSERIAIYRMSYYTDNKGGLWCDYIVVSNSAFTVSFDSWYQRFKKDGTPFGEKVQSSGRFLLTVRDISAITAENASSLKSSTMNLETTIPMFSTLDSVRNYLETGDTTNQINKPVDTLVDGVDDGISFNDTKLYRDDIKLLGFTADYGVNAKWSQFSIGDSFQSFIDKGHYLLNEKAVFVEFIYAYVAAPGQVAYTKYLPSTIDGESLSCYINYNDYVPGDNSVFLRSINFIPAVQLIYFPYGELEGVSTWYYGSANRVNFNSDGTSNSVVSDAGNSQNTHYEYTDSPSSNISGVSGALDSFTGLLDSLYGSLSRVAKFATVVFSWLPWWASLLIGAAVAVCFILRIAGR